MAVQALRSLKSAMGIAEAVLKDNTLFLLRQMMRQPNWNAVHRSRIATDCKMDFVNTSRNVRAGLQPRCSARPGFLLHQGLRILIVAHMWTQPPAYPGLQEAGHSSNTDANNEWTLHLHFSILPYGEVQRFPNRIPCGVCKGFVA
jgi:hypothetical protein